MTVNRKAPVSQQVVFPSADALFRAINAYLERGNFFLSLGSTDLPSTYRSFFKLDAVGETLEKLMRSRFAEANGLILMSSVRMDAIHRTEAQSR